MGPSLFTLYFNDIPRKLLALLALHAEYTTIYSPPHNYYIIYKNLQHYLNLFVEQRNTFRIKINERRTAGVYFSKTYSYSNILTLHNTILPWSDESKYMRVITGKRLTFDEQVLNIPSKIARVFKSTSSFLRNPSLSI